MDSRQDQNLRNDLNAASFPKFGQPKQSVNALPGFESFNRSISIKSSPTSTTYHDFFNNSLPSTLYKSSISNSQSDPSPTPQYSHFQNKLSVSFRSNLKPTGSLINQINETAVVVNAFESLALNSIRGRSPVQKSYDELYHKQLLESISGPSIPGFQYQNSNRRVLPQSQLLNFDQGNSSAYLKLPASLPMNNTSTAESKRFRRRKPNRRLARNAELSFLEDNLNDVEVNLKTMKSIGIGPLCPPNKNSLFPLVTKIHHLCEYISMLGDERCQVESKFLGQEFNSKSSYSVPYSKSLSNQITFVKKCLFIENSMSVNFMKSYGTYLDKEVERNANILLNELGTNTDKLTAFETLRIYQKHGELIQGDGDRIKELELLLSELISDVRHSCMMFFIMKHDGFLKNRQNCVIGFRQRRNIFIG